VFSEKNYGVQESAGSLGGGGDVQASGVSRDGASENPSGTLRGGTERPASTCAGVARAGAPLTWLRSKAFVAGAHQRAGSRRGA